MIKREPCVLVEGPLWGDAEFYGFWLLSAANAQEWLQEGKKNDPEFHSATQILEVFESIDFGITATVFLSRFAESKFHTFTVDTYDFLETMEFVLMVEMEFFKLTGDRYQMTLPENLDFDAVKIAHVWLAGTADDDWIHPERLVVSMPPARASQYQRLLSDMDQNQRIADRCTLLNLD